MHVNGKVSGIYPDRGAFSFSGLLSGSVELGMNQYVVLGDNIDESKDSRDIEVGFVSEEDILGKVG